MSNPNIKWRYGKVPGGVVRAGEGSWSGKFVAIPTDPEIQSKWFSSFDEGVKWLRRLNSPDRHERTLAATEGRCQQILGDAWSPYKCGAKAEVVAGNIPFCRECYSKFQSRCRARR